MVFRRVLSESFLNFGDSQKGGLPCVLAPPPPKKKSKERKDRALSHNYF